MKLSTNTVITICLAAAAILIIPPALSVALAADHNPAAAGVAASGAGQTASTAWDFQPIGAEMSRAIRIFKNRA